MLKNEIELSIIIAALKPDYLEECLKSVYLALKDIQNEIIIIDSASENKTVSQIKKNFPKIQIIRREINGGYGENNNLGMKVARGKYILLLNDDTKIINKDIFKEMISWMDSHPTVGLSSCALVNLDGKTYQGSGGYFPTLPKVIAWMSFLDDIPFLDKIIKPYHPMHGSSFFHTNEDYFKKSHKQDWVTGAFFFIRKKAMDKVGFFDEDFFLYVEEVEFSYRLIKAGWEVWYLPKWKILHYGMTSSGSENALTMEIQNLKLFYKKHMPKYQLSILSLVLKVGVFVRILLFGIYKPNISKIYAKILKKI